MARNERTSARVAAIASKILDGKPFTVKDLKTVAASVLTQARDKKRRKTVKRKAKKAKRK